jgi:hypothetical protein
MVDREVTALKALIEDAELEVQAQIETLGADKYVDQDWLRRARSAHRYMILDLEKIAHRLRGPVNDGEKLSFEIVDIYEKKPEPDDNFTRELVEALRDVQMGQKAILIDSRTRINQIRAAMPRVIDILEWASFTKRRLSYRTRVKRLNDSNMSRITIYRFGEDPE